MRKILNQEQSMKKMYEENPGPKKECEKKKKKYQKSHKQIRRKQKYKENKYE